MKRKLLFGCMTALAVLLTVSCSGDPGVEGILGAEGTSSNGVDGEEVAVTFAVSAANLVPTTRSGETDDTDGGPGQWQNYIGKGKEIDRLIYAVYEVNEKDGQTSYRLQEQYGKGYITNAGASDAENTQAAPAGQTIVKDPFEQEDGKDTYNFELRLMRGKTYSIAFWAQSSKTDAYDTGDLRKVEVKYPQENDTDGDTNNNEYRDAFCKVETFSVGTVSSDASRMITLTRPFAQINVGTTGADYKNYVEQVFGGHYYTASKITVSGVARFMDVVADKVLTKTDLKDDLKDDEDATTTAYFSWAKIPAYVKTEIPTGDQVVGSENTEDSHYWKGEEFLKIKLNSDGGDPALYTTEYPTIDDKTGTYKTETFKYLSMCYVLVLAEKTPKDAAAGDEKDAYKSSVLDNVTVTFAPTKTNEAGTLTFDETATNSFSLTDVPVHRNWRTNILGGLTEAKQTPDPSSLFNSRMVKVQLDTTFDDEYNGTYDDNNLWKEYSKSTNND